VWEMLEYLNDIVDESDPDTDFTQIDHALQTAEAARRAKQPRWMIATGLIHDLGKVLCKFGEPQWAVVGDTNPVGCRFSDKIVHSELFANNPDANDPVYSTELGIYERGCGLEHVHMSWGHDEYLYHVMKERLPIEALYMIRYHSFYSWHREGAYDQLCNDRDRQMLKWVRAFNRYDLYSKDDARPNLDELRPYYADLTQEFFPEPLNW
jgi:inositol oxygenase